MLRLDQHDNKEESILNLLSEPKQLEESMEYKSKQPEVIIEVNDDITKFMGTFGNMNYNGDGTKQTETTK